MAAGWDIEIISVCNAAINLPGVGVVLLELDSEEDCRGDWYWSKHGETKTIIIVQVAMETHIFSTPS